MRALLALVLVAGCTPEFGPDTYYCGPERFCPPNLVCDDNIFSCVEDFQRTEFACPEGSTVHEPDDDTASASDPGDLVCGALVVGTELGCVEGADADLVELRTGASCTGANPHLEIKLRFPVATMPLTVEVLDDAGAVLTAGEVCTPAENFSGREHLCIEITPEADTTYYVRVRAADGAADCSGDCAHNQYLLDIAYPLS